MNPLVFSLVECRAKLSMHLLMSALLRKGFDTLPSLGLLAPLPKIG